MADKTVSEVKPMVTPDLEHENAKSRARNGSLEDRIRRIEAKVAAIEAVVPSEKVIILRDITVEQAKKEIRDLFSTGRTVYYSDIAQELGISLQLVVEICKQLQAAGDIAVDDRVSRPG